MSRTITPVSSAWADSFLAQRFASRGKTGERDTTVPGADLSDACQPMGDTGVEDRCNARFDDAPHVDAKWRTAIAERRDFEARVLRQGDCIHVERHPRCFFHRTANIACERWSAGHRKG